MVDFQKSKCKPCQTIAPLYKKLAEKYSQHGALFFTVDADVSKENLDLMKTVGVKSVPTFFVFHKGERVDVIVGAHIDDLEYLITDELKKKSQPT